MIGRVGVTGRSCYQLEAPTITSGGRHTWQGVGISIQTRSEVSAGEVRCDQGETTGDSLLAWNAEIVEVDKLSVGSNRHTWNFISS